MVAGDSRGGDGGRKKSTPEAAAWALTDGDIGMSSKSIHEVIFMPPLHETGCTGAVGSVHFVFAPADRSLRSISWANDIQPSALSPSPCSHTTT